MSEKSWKSPLSKNEDTDVVHHFEENNYQGDDLHANHNKIDSSVQHLWAFKIPPPPPVHSSFFTCYPIAMFSILGLKFKLKPEI